MIKGECLARPAIAPLPHHRERFLSLNGWGTGRAEGAEADMGRAAGEQGSGEDGICSAEEPDDDDDDDDCDGLAKRAFTTLLSVSRNTSNTRGCKKEQGNK
jgi:hypothetical protein